MKTFIQLNVSGMILAIVTGILVAILPSEQGIERVACMMGIFAGAFSALTTIVLGAVYWLLEMLPITDLSDTIRSADSPHRDLDPSHTAPKSKSPKDAPPRRPVAFHEVPSRKE